MVQAVITRMAGNSFFIKGWSVTLVAALFALAVANTSPSFVYLAYFPTFMFWALDAYFLRRSACSGSCTSTFGRARKQPSTSR